MIFRGSLYLPLIALAMGTARADPVATVVACGGKDVAAYKWDLVELYQNPANRDPDRSKHRLIEGSCLQLTQYGHAWYAFVNSANAEKFLLAPEQYVLPLGGFCAMGVAGYAPKGVPPHLTLAPKVFDFYQGKPYFQTDAGKADLWMKDPLGNIQRAAGNFVKGDYTVRFSDAYRPEHPEE